MTLETQIRHSPSYSDFLQNVIWPKTYCGRWAVANHRPPSRQRLTQWGKGTVEKSDIMLSTPRIRARTAANSMTARDSALTDRNVNQRRAIRVEPQDHGGITELHSPVRARPRCIRVRGMHDRASPGNLSKHDAWRRKLKAQVRMSGIVCSASQ